MKKSICLILSMFMLTGCFNFKGSVQEQTEVETATMDSFDQSYYKIVNMNAKGGSELREEFYLNYGGKNDFQDIGRGLQKISSNYFSTSNHYMSEGQYIKLAISDEMVLKRDSEYSLQPKKGTVIDGIDSPLMVRAVQEQDYFIQDNNKYTLKGVSLAVIVEPRNSQGQGLEEPMSNKAIEKYGEEVIGKLYDVIQKHKGLAKIKDLPILIAVYSATNTATSTMNGRYILSSYCQKEVGEIKELNYENVLFNSSRAEEIDKTTSSEFTTIKTSLKNTAIEAAGLVGEAKYEDGEIQSMVMTANLNVKTYTELLNLTSLIADGINTKFTYDFDCKVLVKSQDELLAVIVKSKGQKAKSYELY